MSGSAVRAAGWTVAVVLIVLQGIGSLLVGTMSLFFAMISDGCYDAPDDPLICSDTGGLVFFGGIFLEWALLLAGFVLSIVLVARNSRAGAGSVAATPLIGIGVGLLGVLAMVLTVAIVSS